MSWSADERRPLVAAVADGPDPAARLPQLGQRWDAPGVLRDRKFEKRRRHTTGLVFGRSVVDFCMLHSHLNEIYSCADDPRQTGVLNTPTLWSEMFKVIAKMLMQPANVANLKASSFLAKRSIFSAKSAEQCREIR